MLQPWEITEISKSKTADFTMMMEIAYNAFSDMFLTMDPVELSVTNVELGTKPQVYVHHVMMVGH